MGQQSLLSIPIVQNQPINFKSQTHEFQCSNVQRVKQTPFINSILYSSQPMIYIESVETTMQALVLPRLNTTKLFPKEQIIKILENLLVGLNQLRQRNFEDYGNLSLTSIFYHKQSKDFKLVNPAFFISRNYLLAREGLRFNFLAPQELLNLTCEQAILTKSFKTDIFILAICLLQICTLRDSQQLYCPQTYSIFDMQVKDRLRDVQQFYSKDLANFLQLCLQYQVQKRIDIQDALIQIRFVCQKEKGQQVKLIQQSSFNAVISPRGDQKKGTLPFRPGNLPKKLNQTNLASNF